MQQSPQKEKTFFRLTGNMNSAKVQTKAQSPACARARVTRFVKWDLVILL